jgi:mono/diheme cytochrome c family protein
MRTGAKVVVGIVIVALAGLVPAAVYADHAGPKVFEANKCSNCHSVEKVKIARKIQSEKMAGPDLSKIGDERDAAWIVKFAMREVEVDGKQHKNEYKGTKDDLQTIANWLASLKSGA